MSKVYQFNFEKGHAYSIGIGFGADSLVGIGFLNFPQGYAYLRNMIYREDGQIRPPYGSSAYNGSVGTDAVKGVYFAIDGLYAYTGDDKLMFSKGGNDEWKQTRWVGSGSEPTIGVEAQKNIQWFDNYGIAMFTSPNPSEPVFWTYTKDIFGDIDIPPVDTGGEPIPDPPIIVPPENQYNPPYGDAQYYYHNAGRTNWVKAATKAFIPKGNGQVYKTFDAGEAIGLAEGGKLYGYPKVYSIPSLDQTGEDLPEDFTAWGSSSVGVKDGVRYDNVYNGKTTYDYAEYVKTVSTYPFETVVEDGRLTFDIDVAYTTVYLDNPSSPYAYTVIYDFDYYCIRSYVVRLDVAYRVFVFEVYAIDGTLAQREYLSAPFNASILDYHKNCFWSNGKLYATVDYQTETAERYIDNLNSYFFNGSEWTKTGFLNVSYNGNYISGSGCRIGLTGASSSLGYILGRQAGDEKLLLPVYDYTATPSYMSIGTTSGFRNYFPCSGYAIAPSTEIVLTGGWAQDILTYPFSFNCSNEAYCVKLNQSLTGKTMSYSVYGLNNTVADKTITLPLSANSSSFQIKESVITDDNIVYFVYHDITNSKIGVIGIDIIENLVYYSYETSCTSFPASQKLFHYGSYIGFNNGANWVIIN